MTMHTLTCGRFTLRLDHPYVMAIINVTPDSFSGDGVGHDLDAAMARAEQALEAGAEILDIGGESTRPGSPAVSEVEEIDRVVPLVERLQGFNVPLSVDTLKPGVMRAALAAGADLINDVNGFRAPGAFEAVVDSNAALCVMHMQGTPQDMQVAPVYADVVREVTDFMLDQARALEAAGVARERIVLDPGFGFGKTLEHNLTLFRALEDMGQHGYPLFVGVSRKAMMGQLSGRSVPAERMVASVAAALLAAQRGAHIIRVHDVAATCDALKVLHAIEGWRAFA